MAKYPTSNDKEIKAQKVLNWKRRKARRMGVQEPDFITRERPMEFDTPHGVGPGSALEFPRKLKVN